MSEDGNTTKPENASGAPVGVDALVRRSRAEDVSPSMMDCPVWAIQEGREDEEGRMEWTVTEGIWFTHAEAFAWANTHKYRFGGKWRVYGLPARGALKTNLMVLTI